MRNLLKIGAALILAALAITGVHAAQENERAQQILETAGVKGGLVVHLGCGEGQLTAALRTNDSYLVHGLDTNPANVQKARARIQSLGKYGPITADLFNGEQLPYTDNLVNLLLVSENPKQIAEKEILRALAPHGVALIRDGDRWRKLVKPRPDDIDEWTHYLHGPDNNAVAHDAQVGPPRHLQWQCGPRWSRHHDHMASVSAMVSAGERLFYILDEGSRVSPQLPSDWQLAARDAFNGVLLWRRAIPQWHTQLWPLKSGPANLPRRLVAQGETVYTTLGIDAPVSALDAATGQTAREYANTAGAEEILLIGDTLLTLINRTPVDMAADLATDPEQGKSRDSRTTYSPEMAKIWAGIRSKRWTHGDRVIRAFNAANGIPLWEKASAVLPLTLAAAGPRAYYHDGQKIIALELATGDVAWRSEPVPVWQGLDGQQGLQSWFAPTLVISGDKVLFAGGEKIHMSYMGWGSKDIGDDTMTALDATTGEKIWTAPHPYCGYNSPEDLFVIDGKVWSGATAKGGPGGRYQACDLGSGKPTDNFPPTLQTSWFHHRCYRAKATDRFILSSRNGIEFVDVKTGEWSINHWVRGGCLYGIMPSNGMIYSPIHPCACYPEAKLYGFTALAPAREIRNPKSEIRNQADRLQHGPAYTAIKNEKIEIKNGAEWPTYRGDVARSGSSASAVSTSLRQDWKATLGGRLTPPVVGGSALYTADLDRHLIHALDAATGVKNWTHTAGGRIDSPPTYDRGRLLFGAGDGYVTCLRASDGALAWRYRAAPLDRRLVAFDRVESVWPAHGAVLVQDGVATVVAGRSMFLDGGLRLIRLDVATGRLLGEKTLDDRDPNSAESSLQDHIKGLNMPVALPDILASDGERLFMRSQAMDLEGGRSKLGPGRSGQYHLFAPYGFTDDSYFHRVYWVYGDGFSGGVGGYGNGKQFPAGRILATNDDAVFGYGRKPQYYRWSSILDYQLFAAIKPGAQPAAKAAAPAAAASGEAKAIYFKNSKSLDPSKKPLTIAAWIKTDAKDGAILVRGANACGFALILSNRKPRMLLRANGKTHEAIADKRIGADWTHVASVLNEKGRMEVYVDGEAAGATENVPLLDKDPQIVMKVGHDDTNQLLPQPLMPFSGALDEVMLFHRALSADEIKQLAKNDVKLAEKSEAGPVLHLAFTKGKTSDGSPAGNHGQLSGGKAEIVKGPVGDALLLTQPKTILAAKAAKGKAQSKKQAAVTYRWTRDAPMTVRAMALAGGALFIAGPEDHLDEDATFQTVTDPATQKQIAAQQAALAGKSGAVLQAVDAATGETKGQHRLDSPPVFDGLIVAAGRVYLVTMDGQVTSFKAEK